MKVSKEKKIVYLMIEIYSKHHDKKELKDNEEMLQLLNYAYKRLDHCPFKDKKSFCSICKIHCYEKTMREKIKKVMRYSGPRIIIYHPILFIKHQFRG